jgi:hypothetical protein
LSPDREVLGSFDLDSLIIIQLMMRLYDPNDEKENY